MGRRFLDGYETLIGGREENGEPEEWPQRGAKTEEKMRWETAGIHHRGTMDTELFRMEPPRNTQNARKAESE